MTKKEIVNRNLGLTFDYVREIISNPSLAEKLPDNCEIEFIEKDFPLKSDASLQNKYLIRVKNYFESLNQVAEPPAQYGKKK